MAVNDMKLAYLNPVSWLATLQMGGAAVAWLYVRYRRLLPSVLAKPKPVRDTFQTVGSLVAIAELSEPPSRPRLVVILEGPRDWPYVGPAIRALRRLDDKDVWIISLTELPMAELSELPFTVRGVSRIGAANWVALASRLQANGVVTTVTDLGTSAFPKSPRCRYVYLFHSLMSTHVSYAQGAFDAYDVLLCPSAVHVDELRFRDARLGRSPRPAVEVGYPVLRKLVDRFSKTPQSRRVVVAPSWSADDLLTTMWPAVADALSAAGWQVTIRPHPETLKRSPDVIRKLTKRYAAAARVNIDTSTVDGGSLGDLDALITDWSGVGTEVALAGRPVFFVDTQRKVRNPDWLLDGANSIEEDVRTLLGTVIRPEEVGLLPNLLDGSWDAPETDRAADFRRRVVSDIDDPGAAAAREIVRFLEWDS